MLFLGIANGKNAEFHVASEHDGLATRTNGGSRGANIIDDEKVLACEWVTFLVAIPFGWRKSLGQLEDILDAVQSSPTVQVSLALFEDDSFYDVCPDGDVGEVGYPLGDFLALVVASFPSSLGSDGNGYDTINVVEKVYSHAFLCQEPSHVIGDVGLVLVFELVKDIAGEGMPLVIEERTSFLDGDKMPEHLCHLVVVRILPGIGSWKMEIAGETDALLLACQSVSADRAIARKKQVDDFR